MSAGATLRFGIAGLGKMGLLHAAVLGSLPGCEVVAGVDPSPLLGGAFRELASEMKVYSSLSAMLEAHRLDGVVIATPVADHVPAALECVRRGIPFLMEKPLAVSAAQALELVVALERAPVPHLIGYMTRFIDTFSRGRELVATGALGRLQRVSATIHVSQLFTRGKGWRYDRKVSGGGVLLSQGSHLLDLLTWYFGPVARVNAQVLPIYSSDIEDFAHVLLEFESGLKGWVDSSWSVRFKRTVETTIDVLGDNGSLVVTDDSVKLFLDEARGGSNAGWTTLSAVDLYRGVPVDIGGPQYTREALAFIEGIRAGRPAEPGARQALHVQRIVDAAYASSARQGAPEAVSP